MMYFITFETEFLRHNVMANKFTAPKILNNPFLVLPDEFIAAVDTDSSIPQLHTIIRAIPDSSKDIEDILKKVENGETASCDLFLTANILDEGDAKT